MSNLGYIYAIPIMKENMLNYDLCASTYTS